ncbi:hypothetical protein FOHLNKBM_2988 [Methylobacterium longum]|nr:hypothetical protein [Methylobacterium sp. E-046]GJE11942.1 hypothetical protein FOHLNKBM_2988 [Methylobacterium longum]
MYNVGVDARQDVLLADSISTRGDPGMDAFEHGDSSCDTTVTVEPRDKSELMALWSALDADYRARDERTARLRAMRLIAGEDEAA